MSHTFYPAKNDGQRTENVFYESNPTNSIQRTGDWGLDDQYQLIHKRSMLRPCFQNICYVSVPFAFTLGLLVGIVIPIVYFTNIHATSNYTHTTTNAANNNIDLINNTKHNSQFLKRILLANNTHRDMHPDRIVPDAFPPVKFITNQSEIVSRSAFIDRQHDNSADEIIRDGIFWGSKVESLLPAGYDSIGNDLWNRFVKNSIAKRLELGCGRMQNRLLTFADGSQACVRYRQNTDQIQGELFSFYLAQILKLPNLAPSTIEIIDLTEPIWQNIVMEISSAQWSANRPVVLTKFIPDLDAAYIPRILKPTDRHLNKNDIRNITGDFGNIPESGRIVDELIELAQWSDLIIFDYLTANLDRIVNNLYNFQWNSNIMDAPAHNLARKIDSNLLLFLDNESGLLHGYRLLKKYEVYHSLLLDNLCIFRKSTADAVRSLKEHKNIGQLLRDMFERQNNRQVKDILPTLPEKSIKVLNERIERVYSQIAKCASTYSELANTWR